MLRTLILTLALGAAAATATAQEAKRAFLGVSGQAINEEFDLGPGQMEDLAVPTAPLDRGHDPPSAGAGSGLSPRG